MTDLNPYEESLAIELKSAQERIEALVKERDATDAAWSERVAQITAALTAAEAVAEKLRGALSKLHHAVCGETGFAACVRLDSGKAYPWPALDEADAAARAALTTEERHE